MSEMEAAVFMNSFYKTYPAVKVFTQSVIEECRAKGYVETLTKRRRYLPEITSIAGAKKSKCLSEVDSFPFINSNESVFNAY